MDRNPLFLDLTSEIDRWISSLSESLLFTNRTRWYLVSSTQGKLADHQHRVTTSNIGGTLLIDPPRLPDCRDGITPRHFASGTGLVQTPIERHSSAPFIGFPWSLRARSFHWPAALKCDALKEDRLFSPVLAQNRFFPPSLFFEIFNTIFVWFIFFYLREVERFLRREKYR